MPPSIPREKVCSFFLSNASLDKPIDYDHIVNNVVTYLKPVVSEKEELPHSKPNDEPLPLVVCINEESEFCNDIIIELKNRSRTIFSQAAKLLVAARMGGLNRLHSQPT